jgi:hypothetical protein
MSTVTHVLGDLEAKASAGQALSWAEAERVSSTTDLVSVGVLGELARRAHTQDAVTFGRVLVLDGTGVVHGRPEQQAGAAVAGEVRISATPASIDQAVEWVRSNVPGTSVCYTAFSLATLWQLCDRQGAALIDAARRLREARLDAVADVALDGFESADDVVAALAAVREAGLAARRATIGQASATERLDLIRRSVEVQERTRAFLAFAPLPRLDPAGEPSTGYDDVRTVAVARLVAANIPYIQVDWPLYGPKLAQVALAFGANDIDGIDVVDGEDRGPRRTAVEDITRQILAASAVPHERDGRYERRA